MKKFDEKKNSKNIEKKLQSNLSKDEIISKAYLNPHLSKRSVFTTSDVQIRSKINSKSIGGWKKYKGMLKPAIKIITQNDEFKNLKNDM
tara:strand:- start:239 stop:505 length:267 start_codon:yes stop_codon:yes gene_type:complete